VMVPGGGATISAGRLRSTDSGMRGPLIGVGRRATTGLSRDAGVAGS
jgi:hypothetical protein